MNIINDLPCNIALLGIVWLNIDDMRYFNISNISTFNDKVVISFKYSDKGI